MNGRKDGLTRGPLTQSCAHLCVDMQNMFACGGPWETPWMERVLPRVAHLCERFPERSVFTRFVPARRAEDAPGMWRLYYECWKHMTLDRLAPGMVELVAPLARLTPPAAVVDKRVYSPWLRPELPRLLRSRGVDALIVSGGETDVCVLASVLGAVDRGYRVVVAEDCLCSSSDDTHDALTRLYAERFGQQIEVATSEEILDAWR